MKQNIYDNEVFFNNYNSKRQLKKGTFANDLIEIPTIRLMLPPLTNLKILELGCGYGDNCSYFIKKKAKSVLGIDISQNMINLAQKNNNSPQISYKVMAIEDIANLDEKFDLIISSLALHYVADLNQVLKDVYNLLNYGGYFIFSQEHPLETAPILNEL